MSHRINVSGAEQSANFYRHACGFAPVWKPTVGRIDLTTGDIVGITMPGARGHAVADDMKARDFALGPIVGHQQSGNWTFLVRPDLPTDVHFCAELVRLDATVVRDGEVIALPATRLDLSLYWVEQPHDTFRPSGLVVVDALRRTAVSPVGVR